MIGLYLALEFAALTSFLDLGTVKFGLMSECSHVFGDNRRDYQLLIPQTYGQVVGLPEHQGLTSGSA